MVIQGSINNLLHTAGVAAAISPQLREKAETKAKTRRLEKTISGLEKAREEAIEQDANILQQPIAENLARAQQELAFTDPSKVNIKNWAIEAEGAEEIEKSDDKIERGSSYEQKIQNRIKAMQAAEQDIMIKQQEKLNGRIR